MSVKSSNGRSKSPARGTSDARRADASAGAPADSPEKVRNVVLVGHSGAGKTMLVEALLAATGVISRMGSITDGNTVSDAEPSEVHQQRSVVLSVAPLVVDGIKVNLLDTPGYGDFTGELRAGLRGADAALFVVSAIDGIDAATTALWAECDQVGMPRAVVISRLDHPRANFEATVAACQRSFGDSVVPAYLPVRSGDATTGLLGLLTQTVSDYSAGSAAPQVREATAEELTAAEGARGTLIEGIISES
jgi:elongation factor G